MSKVRSILYSMKEAKYNPLTLTHATLYGATGTYLKVLDKLMGLNIKTFNNHVQETYHGKVVRINDAAKFIKIDKNIELTNLDQVLPYKRAKDIILNNPQNIVAHECGCRARKKDPCRPTEVCLVIGEPFVDLVRILRPLVSRRINQDEALEILREEDERGHFHSAWFKTAMLNRFYSICNCCSCCCIGMKGVFEYKTKVLLPSGYRAVMGDDCVGCGQCAQYCQFSAIEMISTADNGKETQKAQVIQEKCFGCGVCESKCSENNISLVLDPEKGPPLDIEALA